jgi:predicted porin
MIKKILPTMIGVALAGSMSAAAADISVFGHIDTSIDNVDVSDNGAPPGAPDNADDTNLHCTTCSIGFKGSEDLGNGLKAIFSLDFQYNTTERNSRSINNGTYGGAQNDTLGNEPVANAITDRDQWLGLSGGFGKVRVGTISTVYKSHGAMIDPLYRTSLQGRDHHLQINELHSGAGEETQGRATNTFRWDSPSYSGFQVGAHYTLDNNEQSNEDDNPYGIGLSYENGGILAFADYITNDSSDSVANGTREISAWKVGGKFAFSDFAVMGQYEDADGLNAINDETTQWHIAGSYTMGSNLLYLAYGNRESENTGITFEDADSWTIAGVHNMSKNTSVYAGYNNIQDDYAPGLTWEMDQFTLGMKHKF